MAGEPESSPSHHTPSANSLLISRTSAAGGWKPRFPPYGQHAGVMGIRTASFFRAAGFGC